MLNSKNNGRHDLEYPGQFKSFQVRSSLNKLTFKHQIAQAQPVDTAIALEIHLFECAI